MTTPEAASALGDKALSHNKALSGNKALSNNKALSHNKALSKDLGLEARFQLKQKDFQLDVSFSAPGKGVTGIFGPSGSGKTTLLRCIAGLENPDQGYLSLKGDCWQDDQQHRPIHRPTHRRPIGYVFQEASLFPHLNVQKNMQYGWQRIAKDQRKLRFDEVTSWLGLETLLQRSVDQLSGGQRQRVAIARALLTSPQLLLMDEPLANLDLDGKAEILPYLENLHEELDIPVLYVSHSPQEIQQLADYLILLDKGTIQAQGELNTLLTDPQLPIAHFEDAAAVLEATVVNHDKEFHLTTLSFYVDQAFGGGQAFDGSQAFDGTQVSVSYNDLPIGHKARLRICARDVSLALIPPQKISISNSFAVQVVSVDPDRDPSQMLVRCEVAGQVLLARVTRRSVHTLNIVPDKTVYAQVKSVALMK